VTSVSPIFGEKLDKRIDGASLIVKHLKDESPKSGWDADYALEKYSTQAPKYIVIGSFPHDAGQ